MKTSLRGTRRRVGRDLGDDPFAMLVNFFDCSIVFALGFIVALLARAPSAMSPSTPPGSTQATAGNLADAQKAPLKPTSDTATGPGQRLGVAYRLDNGDVVYVPDIPR